MSLHCFTRSKQRSSCGPIAAIHWRKQIFDIKHEINVIIKWYCRDITLILQFSADAMDLHFLSLRMKCSESLQGYASNILFLLLVAHQISQDRELSCPWNTSLYYMIVVRMNFSDNVFALLHQIQATFVMWPHYCNSLAKIFTNIQHHLPPEWNIIF